MYRLQTPNLIEKILSQSTLTVGTTPTPLNLNSLTRVLVIENTSTNPVHYGNENVSTTSGISIQPSEVLVLFVKADINLFLVANTPSQIKIMEAY
jgi:hypothetical protein